MMKTSFPILISAPGAGLGHLVRACALALRLAERGLPARVLSQSPYAEGLARLTGCAIDRIPPAGWPGEVAGYVARLDPALVVVDTFPWGIRGEWRGEEHAKRRFVYLARRLRLDEYVNAGSACGASRPGVPPGHGRPRRPPYSDTRQGAHAEGKTTEVPRAAWNTHSPQVKHVIVAEPLAEAHEALIAAGATETCRLPGRIRFPAERCDTPLPRELDKLLDTGKLRLIVHSGPEEEVRTLVAAAQRETAAPGDTPPALIAPKPIAGLDLPTFEYFPASRLFDRAARIITGAGYNTMAEGAVYAEKHVAVPFPRRFDDQPARLAGPPAGPDDGGHAAASFIERLCSMLTAPTAAVFRDSRRGRGAMFRRRR
ncbi:MAG: hypothetical protein JXR37_11645 [Kiritimatiellae bacterium]|nr:hypothetical protein [Kiritimatiellia bacterium]